MGVHGDVAGTLGTKSGRGRITDIDNAGAYVVNEPIAFDVYNQIADETGLFHTLQSKQRGYDVVGLINVPTADTVGTISGGGASRLVQRAGRLHRTPHTRTNGS